MLYYVIADDSLFIIYHLHVFGNVTDDITINVVPECAKTGGMAYRTVIVDLIKTML